MRDQSSSVQVFPLACSSSERQVFRGIFWHVAANVAIKYEIAFKDCIEILNKCFLCGCVCVQGTSDSIIIHICCFFSWSIRTWNSLHQKVGIPKRNWPPPSFQETSQPKLKTQKKKTEPLKKLPKKTATTNSTGENKKKKQPATHWFLNHPSLPNSSRTKDLWSGLKGNVACTVAASASPTSPFGRQQLGTNG